MIRLMTKCSTQIARSAILWLTLFTVGSTFADNSKISPDLLPLLSNPSTQVNVIVQYTAQQTQQSCGGLLGLL